MADAFRSADDFDEQAHQLYNEARYDEALALLREGLSLYPSSVELHIGSAYAWMAMEEFAWSRDGRRIAYHSRRHGQWGIYLLSYS